MKTIVQAMLAAAAILAMYCVTAFAAGYAEAVMHRPNIAEAWGNAEYLQTEVAFGGTSSPLSFLLTFLGLSLIWWVVLLVYQKLISKPQV